MFLQGMMILEFTLLHEFIHGMKQGPPIKHFPFPTESNFVLQCLYASQRSIPLSCHKMEFIEQGILRFQILASCCLSKIYVPVSARKGE